MIMKVNCSNELTKNDSKAIQGIAILFMLALHLFCRRDNLPYTTFLNIKGVPIVYYLGLWGDQCVALFCFCAGYAGCLQQEKYDKKKYMNYSIKRLMKLVMNYWMIVVLVSLIGLLIGRGEAIPGSFVKFLSNFFMISNSYNGAWWFMLTYIILIVLSVWIYRIIKKCNGVIVLGVTGIIYLVSYIVRFDIIHVPDMGVIVNWFISQGALLGTSLLPFVFGMLFYKYSVISKIRKWTASFTKCTIIVLTIMVFVGCMVTHAIVQSLIIAPIYALITVSIISLWRGKVISVFKYFGEHSTNIWLVHMFFYTVLFEGFIFRFKYPIIVFVMMLGLGIASSYIINFMLKSTISKIKITN